MSSSKIYYTNRVHVFEAVIMTFTNLNTLIRTMLMVKLQKSVHKMNNYDSTAKPTTKCRISHEPHEEDLTFTAVIFLGFFLLLFPGAFVHILYVFAFCVDGMAFAWAVCSSNVTFAWASNAARASLNAESISWIASLPWTSCYARIIFWNKFVLLGQYNKETMS